MISKILVGLADTPSVDATIQRAVELAQKHGASVTGITLMPLDRHSRVGPCGVGNSHAAKRMVTRRCEDARGRLRTLAERLEDACLEGGVTCRLVAAEGNVVQMLRTYSEGHDLTLSSIAVDDNDHVLRELCDFTATNPRPTIAVPGQHREVSQALIAYDGSEAARHAVEMYATTNPWPEAAIRVVHFGADEAVGMGLVNEALDTLRRHGLTRIEGQFQRGKVGQLEQYADDCKADVIVIGNKGRGALMRLLGGDTARGLLRRGDRLLFMAH